MDQLRYIVYCVSDACCSYKYKEPNGDTHTKVKARALKYITDKKPGIHTKCKDCGEEIHMKTAKPGSAMHGKVTMG